MNENLLDGAATFAGLTALHIEGRKIEFFELLNPLDDSELVTVLTAGLHVAADVARTAAHTREIAPDKIPAWMRDGAAAGGGSDRFTTIVAHCIEHDAAPSPDNITKLDKEHRTRFLADGIRLVSALALLAAETTGVSRAAVAQWLRHYAQWLRHYAQEPDQ